METEERRVLSIQGHVVRGYVGNKAATFPLQILGFEVDPLNSVHLSNHPGYGHWNGQVLQSNELEELFDSLKKNDLIKRYTHILTGYSRSKSFLEKLAQIIQEIKTANPNVVYVCDPVMGDNGKMYVPEELLSVYKEKFLHLCDIITPNQFEAELLTNIEIKTEADAIKVIEKLHSKGISTVIISSTNLSKNQNQLICYASTGNNNGTPTNKHIIYKIEIEKLAFNFNGTGDLFAALFLAWFHKTNSDLKVSLEKSISILQDIIKTTYQFAMKNDFKQKVELKLIQSIDNILSPKTQLEAIRIN